MGKHPRRLAVRLRDDHQAVPLWFLPCLALVIPAAMACMRFAKLLGRDRHTLGAVGIAFGLFASGAWLLAARGEPPHHQLGWGSPAASGWPWSADLVPLGAGYAVIGAIVVGPLTHSKPAMLRRLLAGLLLLFLALSVAQMPRIDLNLRVFTPAVTGVLASLSGAGVVLIAARLMRPTAATALLAALGTATLPILALHNPLQHALGNSLSVWMGKSSAAAGALAALAGLLAPWWLDKLVFARTRWGQLLFHPRMWLESRRTSCTIVSRRVP